MKNSHSIYRFISFETFVDMVQKQNLTFVNYKLWDDPYEGYIFKALKTEYGRIQIEKIAKTLLPNDFILVLVLDNFTEVIHAQSWSKCVESDAMWRIYSYGNKAVRVEVKKDKIDELKNITYNKVIYKNFRSLKDEIKEIIEKKRGKIEVKVDKILLRKRTAFSHEEEVRLLTKGNLDYLTTEKQPKQSTDLMKKGLSTLRAKGKITKEQYQTGMQNVMKQNSPPQTVSVDFSHIKDFISSVLVHPLSPDWYVDTVAEYCKRNKIEFLGKSKLYTFLV